MTSSQLDVGLIVHAQHAKQPRWVNLNAKLFSSNTLCISVDLSLSFLPHWHLTCTLCSSYHSVHNSHLTPPSTPFHFSSQADSSAGQEEILICWEKQQPKTLSRVPGLGSVCFRSQVPVLDLSIQVPCPWSRFIDPGPCSQGLGFLFQLSGLSV